MKDWQKTLVLPDAPISEAMGVIDRAGTNMALVVDAQGRLLGTLSDGDVRRGLLRGARLDQKVADVMHLNPTVARSDAGRETVLGLMRRIGVRQMPIVDERGMVVGLATVDDYLITPVRDNWVVIMAGGLGTRLKELTRDTPKPMLRVGAQPLLETIVRSYSEHGFRKFYLAVNYKAEQIEQHFGDGREFGVEIDYLREQERMGTAGALSLLPKFPDRPVIVANGDLLTRQDYGAMMDRHAEAGAAGTMAVRDYEMQVPFGVVLERDGRIERIDEKPIQRFVVSAGIYVLSPEALELVPHGEFTDMPALFQLMSEKGLRTRCHYIDGYWLDIGRLSDYERANLEFDKVFQ